jgi:hypothetical protein
MVDRQFIAARMVAATRRCCRRSSSRVSTATRCGDPRPQLGLGHPRIDANYRSTIQAT